MFNYLIRLAEEDVTDDVQVLRIHSSIHSEYSRSYIEQFNAKKNKSIVATALRMISSPFISFFAFCDRSLSQRTNSLERGLTFPIFILSLIVGPQIFALILLPYLIYGISLFPFKDIILLPWQIIKNMDRVGVFVISLLVVTFGALYFINTMILAPLGLSAFVVFVASIPISFILADHVSIIIYLMDYIERNAEIIELLISEQEIPCDEYISRIRNKDEAFFAFNLFFRAGKIKLVHGAATQEDINRLMSSITETAELSAINRSIFILIFEGNGIQELSIPNNLHNLRALNVMNNQLTYLNLDNHPLLQEILAANNNLHSIYFTDRALNNLKRLFISNNQLSRPIQRLLRLANERYPNTLIMDLDPAEQEFNNATLAQHTERLISNSLTLNRHLHKFDVKLMDQTYLLSKVAYMIRRQLKQVLPINVLVRIMKFVVAYPTPASQIIQIVDEEHKRIKDSTPEDRPERQIVNEYLIQYSTRQNATNKRIADDVELKFSKAMSKRFKSNYAFIESDQDPTSGPSSSPTPMH